MIPLFLYSPSLMFFKISIVQMIAIELIKGIIIIAGPGSTPTKLIPIIFPVRAIINKERKTMYMGAIK